MGSEDRPPTPDLSAAERDALHEVELGVEHLHRAHGHLVSFHHDTGRAMDHLAEAEERLRGCGYDDLADRLRAELLPRGPVAGPDEVGGRWTFELLEGFQEGFLADVVAFGDDAAQRVADGLRHPAERRQQRDWRERARRD